MRHQKIEVQNLKCGGCAEQIRSELSKIDGVSSVKIDTENSMVEFETEQLEYVDAARSRLNQMGYPAKDEHNPITKVAKSYISCMIGRTKK